LLGPFCSNVWRDNFASQNPRLTIPTYFTKYLPSSPLFGKNESAIEHLKAAVTAGWIDYRSLSLDPRFDAIADDVGFQTILGKLKLRVEDLSKKAKTGL